MFVQKGEIVFPERFPLLPPEPAHDTTEHRPERGQEQDSCEYLHHSVQKVLLHVAHTLHPVSLSTCGSTPVWSRISLMSS